MRRAIALFLTLAWVSGAHAAVYKCADERGEAYYADLPPPERSCERIRTSAPDPAETDAARKELADKLFQSDTARQHKQEEEQKRREREERQRRQAEDCQRAREQLAQLQGPGRVARVNDRGERALLGPDERQTSIAETQKRIAETCR